MGSIGFRPGTHLALRLAAAAGFAALLAGCADSERLADPFSNPFHTARNVDNTSTASIPTSSVQSRPLPAPSNYRAVGAPSAAYAAPSHQSPSLGAAPQPANDMTSSLGRGQNVAGWTAEGGTPVVVAQGETVEVIARRYGIPPDALLRTNGFSASNQVRPGTRLVIPVYNAALAAASGAHVADHGAKGSRPNEKLVFVKGAKPADEARRVAKNEGKAETRRERLAAEERDHAKSEPRGRKEIAKAEEEKRADLKAKAVARETAREAAKSGARETAKEAAKKEIVKREVAQKEIAQETAKDVVRTSAPAEAAKVEQAVVKKTPVDVTTTASLPESDSPEFRWPARGRVIQGFKNGGNDGINIALPEGTSVRAAEAGVVAYAGSELKSYGNLVLIRHPNGFVTAYANNGELDVKQGETVKRGQVIAKSGQSGNVASPQLHFEVRKGKTPVDPTQYLAGL